MSASSAFAAGSSGTVALVNNIVTPGGSVIVWTDGLHANPDGCAYSNAAILPITSASPTAEMAFQLKASALLTGLVSSKNLELTLNGCSGNYPIVDQVVVMAN